MNGKRSFMNLQVLISFHFVFYFVFMQQLDTLSFTGREKSFIGKEDLGEEGR